LTDDGAGDIQKERSEEIDATVETDTGQNGQVSVD
jgi:hypothetical protein